ncbi:MAG TPA: hypothetical protein VF209_00755 [Patescibacteria group bacterium]
MRSCNYTKELLNELCTHIGAGLSNKDAALLAGISESTFYLWQSDKANNPLTVDEKLELLESIKKARLARKKKFIGIIEKAAETHWQAAAWYLERAYFEEFGKKPTGYLPPTNQPEKKVFILPSNGREKFNEHAVTE